MENCKVDDLKRIQNSILSKIEKRILIKLANIIPDKINPDHLTIIGFIGSIITGLSYYLTTFDVIFFWLASLGLVINWFGDSLDGTVARVRNIQRPLYGFFIDHNTDALTALLIALGAGLSPYFSLSLLLVLLIGYYLLSILTYINSILLKYFKISYGIFGPTELRLFIIFVNTILFFTVKNMPVLKFLGFKILLTDFFALIVCAALYILYFYYFLLAKKEYVALDPPKNKK